MVGRFGWARSSFAGRMGCAHHPKLAILLTPNLCCNALAKANKLTLAGQIAFGFA